MRTILLSFAAFVVANAASADEFVDMAKATCSALATPQTALKDCLTRQESAARANAALEEKLRAAHDRPAFARLQQCAKANRLRRDVYDEVAVQACVARSAPPSAPRR